MTMSIPLNLDAVSSMAYVVYCVSTHGRRKDEMQTRLLDLVCLSDIDDERESLSSCLLNRFRRSVDSSR